MRISDLPAASSATATDQIEVNQGGISKRITVDQLHTVTGAGTVGSVSVVTANGLAGTVATATTTPAITLSTTVSGLAKGNGTALSTAVAGTDYMTPGNVSSAYLALAGGTLIGALTGTTATFSGEVTAATPPLGDADTSVANTEWVQGEIASIPPTGATVTGYWLYNSAALVPPPVAGRVRLSVAWPPAVASSLHFYIAAADADGFAYTWAVGPSVGDLLVFKAASGGRLVGAVTAKTIAAYLDITVSVSAVSGTLNNGARCQISAVPLGAGGYLPVSDPAFIGTLTGPTATLMGRITALSATAVGAGAATQAFIKASSTADLGIYFGTGNPSFSAAKGSLYTNTTAATTTTRLWVNTNGSTTWANFTSSA